MNAEIASKARLAIQEAGLSNHPAWGGLFIQAYNMLSGQDPGFNKIREAGERLAETFQKHFPLLAQQLIHPEIPGLLPPLPDPDVATAALLLKPEKIPQPQPQPQPRTPSPELARFRADLSAGILDARLIEYRLIAAEYGLNYNTVYYHFTRRKRHLAAKT